MSMYKQFQTDEALEKSGIVLDYGNFRVTVARAGGANKRYAQVLDAVSKPYRRAIQSDSLSAERGEAILREVYAKTVIQNWEVNQGTEQEPNWVKGVEGPNGDVLPVTAANLIQTFAALPDLFNDIREQASKAALFRHAGLEADAGN